MKVKECMCKNVCSAKPETTIYDITKIMKDEHIGCVPICDGQNSIVGLVTDRDIVLRGVATNKDIKTTPVSEIMTTKVCCCKVDDEINTAQRKMSEEQIRRLPVVENNKVVGILTMGDLAHYGDEIGKNQVCSTIEGICNCDNSQVRNCY